MPVAATPLFTAAKEPVSQDAAARSFVYRNAIAALQACDGKNLSDGRALHPVYVLLKYLKVEHSLHEAMQRTTPAGQRKAEALRRELENMQVDAEVCAEKEAFMSAHDESKSAALWKVYDKARTTVEARLAGLSVPQYRRWIAAERAQLEVEMSVQNAAREAARNAGEAESKKRLAEGRALA